ncbi:MAG: metallophosphoesterase [Eubacterium sp.]|nr:metallophosphoesterase [Eubacterium sp.]
MWGIILGLVFAGTTVGIIYLFTRFQKFRIVRRLSGGRKWVRRGLAAIPILIFMLFCLLDMINSIIVLLHMMIFWALADLGAFLIRRIRGRGKKNPESGKDAEEDRESPETAAEKENEKPYWMGLGVILFTACYLCVGWYLVHHVWITRYSLSTDKSLGQETLRVAMFADSHVGAVFDGEGFAEHMKQVEAEKPDLVLIAGDYVDDSTTKEDMIRSCQALGELETTYGVYYSIGNHDRGYFRSRNFSYDELLEELEKNGVHILRDEAELINDSFYVVGRLDKSVKERLSMEELKKKLSLDPEKYTIVLDHQPSDYAKEAEAGMDLVLSGHTHGGQLIPINYVGEWIGANDRTYGLETRDRTTFIVTSGIADWAIKFKTGTKSEFVVIDITGK